MVLINDIWIPLIEERLGLCLVCNWYGRSAEVHCQHSGRHHKIRAAHINMVQSIIGEIGTDFVLQSNHIGKIKALLRLDRSKKLHIHKRKHYTLITSKNSGDDVQEIMDNLGIQYYYYQHVYYPYGMLSLFYFYNNSGNYMLDPDAIGLDAFM